jgi:hypothetical protein
MKDSEVEAHPSRVGSKVGSWKLAGLAPAGPLDRPIRSPAPPPTPPSIFSSASPRLEQVAAIEAALTRGLEPAREPPHVRGARVKGVIGVVELDRIDDLDALKRRFIEAGVFVRPFRNIVYLTPPLPSARRI